MLLFIYGTLMTGGSNHRILVRPSSFGMSDRPKLLGDYWIDGAQLWHLGGAPALKIMKDNEYEPHTNKVYGELWDVPNMHVITVLDPLEWHPSLYCRRTIAYEPEQRRDIEAYVFQYDTSHCERILSGKWPARVDVLESVANGGHGVETH